MARLLLAALLLLAARGGLATSYSRSMQATTDGKQYVQNTFTFPSVRTTMDATIAVTGDSDCSYVVCFKYLVAMHADVEEFAAICDYTLDSALHSGLHMYPRPGVWHVLVSASSDKKCEFKLTLQGDACGSSHYSNGEGGCYSPSFLDTSDQFGLDVGENKTWAYFPQAWNVRESTLSFTANQGAASSFSVYVREGSYPVLASGHYDNVWQSKAGVVDATLAAPRRMFVSNYSEDPFLYFFTVVNTGDSDADLSFQVYESSCPPLRHGAQCLTYVGPLADVQAYSVPLKAGWWYAAPLLNETHQLKGHRHDPANATLAPLSVGLQRLEFDDDGAVPTPYVYLRLGNLPSEKQWDMKLVWDTDDIRWYTTFDTYLSIGEWYVGILATSTNQAGQYGLWFQDDCPVGCNGNGECKHHQCDCDDDFSVNPFSCAVEGSFSKEFSSYISKGDDDGSSSDLSGGEITLIVFLVIIGSILVVSCVANGVFLFLNSRNGGGGRGPYEILQGL